MGQVLFDVLPVGTGQARQVNRRVVDPEVVALADQTLGEVDERALAQLVGAGLEGEAEQSDAAPAVRGQELVGPAEMCLVGGRMLSSIGTSTCDPVRLVHQSSQVLREARAAEAEAGRQVRLAMFSLRSDLKISIS